MPRDLLALARQALDAIPSGRDISERSEQSPLPAPLSSLSSLNSRPADRRRCWTCGEAATGTFDDGSPRWHHGHDSVTGVRWSVPARTMRIGSVRICPGCGCDHPVGTTCAAGIRCDISERSEESPATTPATGDPADDLVDAARAIFGDDVAGAGP